MNFLWNVDNYGVNGVVCLSSVDGAGLKKVLLPNVRRAAAMVFKTLRRTRYVVLSAGASLAGHVHRF